MNNTNGKIPTILDQANAEIGTRIAARMKQIGLTQEQAAEKAGLSHQFLACVERGIKNMRANNVVKVAQALDVSTDYLLTGCITEADGSKLIATLKTLTFEERYHLEKVIYHYLWTCGYHEDFDD